MIPSNAAYRDNKNPISIFSTVDASEITKKWGVQPISTKKFKKLNSEGSKNQWIHLKTRKDHFFFTINEIAERLKCPVEILNKSLLSHPGIAKIEILLHLNLQPNWEVLQETMSQKFDELNKSVEFLYQATIKTIQLLLENPTLFLGLPDNPTHFTRKQLGLPLPIEVGHNGQLFVILKPETHSAPFATGAYKQVYYAIDLKTFSFAAWAKIVISEEIRHLVNEEIEVQSQLTHQGIVKLYHHNFYTTKTETKIGLMMEYCDYELNEILADFIVNPFTEDERMQLWDVIEDVAGALSEMEFKKIHHRDIKPENIFIKIKNGRWRGKIGDFGFAITQEKEMLQFDHCGTSYFLAPNYCKGIKLVNDGIEMIKSEKMPPRFVNFKFFYSESVIKQGQDLIDEGVNLYAQSINDIWSLGLTLYEMRTGRDSRELISDEIDEFTPKEDLYKIIQNINQEHILRKFSQPIPPNSLEELNYAMLSVDPKKRPSAKECFLRIRALRKKKATFE